MLKKLFSFKSKRQIRYYGATNYTDYRCKLLVVGGGTGGCNIAWRFAKKLKPGETIILLEPSQYHYYQPAFPLIAAGTKKYESCHRPLRGVLPSTVCWLRDSADCFDPCNCLVHTDCGHRVFYEYMVVAVGVKNDYDKIIGLKTALDDPNSGVSTIYSSHYCYKTRNLLSNLKGGHAVFCYTPKGVKCAGAAQKITYLADNLFRKKKIRKDMNITYNTGGDALFRIPKFSESLNQVAKDRGITVNCGLDLREVTKKEAVFVDRCGETISLPYNFLHVTPPMSPPCCLTNCDVLVNKEGYLDVDQYSLQHNTYPNIYGVGDCISAPNNKTAAAISAQGPVLEENLWKTMQGEKPTAKYDGYGACAILTSYKKAILAEFLYDKKLRETFPFDQSKESRILGFLIVYYFPYLYWNKLIKGKYNGPETMRKIFKPFSKSDKRSM